MPETDGGTPPARRAPGTGSVSDERLLAAQLVNETWRLLDQAGRTAARRRTSRSPGSPTRRATCRD